MTTAQTVNGRIISYAIAQETGQRANQEDRYAVEELTTTDGVPAVLALVADGIGGHTHGELASEMACTSVPMHLAAQAPRAEDMGLALRRAVEETGREIYASTVDDPNREGMGTTCTAMVLVSDRLYLAHVGDSRLYLLHGDRLQQLSIDHTFAEEAIRAGWPAEDIRTHPNRGVLRRHLGIDPTIEVDTRYYAGDGGSETRDALAQPVPVAPGDVLMLCSDGVADALEAEEIQKILQAGKLGQAASGLVHAAQQSGATDNVTAIVLRVPGGKEPAGFLRGLFILACA